MNLEQYLPVILFILVGVGVGVAPQVLGFLLGPRLNAAGRLADMRLGVECLLTEDASRALQIADRGYVMESGLITLTGEARKMLDDPQVRAAYLGE